MTTSRRAAKIAISLPPEQLEYLKAAEEAGRGSVSGHIQRLIQREREAAEVDETLRRLFADQPRPGAEHEAWAERALGVRDSDGANGTAYAAGAASEPSRNGKGGAAPGDAAA